MQSLSSVIKYSKVMDQGHKEIVTNAEVVHAGDNKSNLEDNPAAMKSYENIGAAIIENARIQSEQIKSDAFIEAQLIVQNAYREGYENGRQQAYNETIAQATQQAESIMKESEDYASKLIESGKLEYENYLNIKVEDIKALAISIAEQVLKEKLHEADCINNMIFDAVKTVKDTKIIIIKCNDFHLESVKNEIDNWKQQIPFLNEIFVVKDNFLDKGMAVIEKDNGKIEVGIDLSMNKIKEAIMD